MDSDIENYYDDLEGPEEERYRPQRHVPSPPSSLNKPYLTYGPERHTSEAFTRFSEFRTKNKLCDVVIKVGELTLHAHRVVLAACSPYFSAMFSGGMIESQQGVVNFRDLDPKAIEALVDFLLHRYSDHHHGQCPGSPTGRLSPANEWSRGCLLQVLG